MKLLDRLAGYGFRVKDTTNLRGRRIIIITSPVTYKSILIDKDTPLQAIKTWIKDLHHMEYNIINDFERYGL